MDLQRQKHKHILHLMLINTHTDRLQEHFLPFFLFLFNYCRSSMANLTFHLWHLTSSLPSSLLPFLPHSACPLFLPLLLCLAALVWPLPSLAGGRSRCPELANNNQGIALCDTPSLGLDNEQATDSRFAGEWQPLEHGPMRAENWGREGRGGERYRSRGKVRSAWVISQKSEGFLTH